MESMASLAIPALRLRHPLRPRHLPAGRERRLAARAARGLAVGRQSLGIRAARGQPIRSASAAPSRRSTTAASCRAAPGTPPSRSPRSPTTRRSSAGAGGTSTRCGCGRRAPTDPLSLDDFNRGDHVGALADRVRLESISRVLYPSDETPAGQELRLRQEYLLRVGVAAGPHPPAPSSSTASSRTLADHVAIQLNDTHPAIAIAELMRLLVDVHGMPWAQAWHDHDGDVQLHQPHAAAGSAGELAGAADGAAAAAAHADHLPDQRAPSRRRARGRARATAPSCRRCR